MARKKKENEELEVNEVALQEETIETEINEVVEQLNALANDQEGHVEVVGGDEVESENVSAEEVVEKTEEEEAEEATSPDEIEAASVEASDETEEDAEVEEEVEEEVTAKSVPYVDQFNARLGLF